MNALQLLNAKHLRHVAVIGEIEPSEIRSVPSSRLKLPALDLFLAKEVTPKYEFIEQHKGRCIRLHKCQDDSVNSYAVRISKLLFQGPKPAVDCVLLGNAVAENANELLLLVVDQILIRGGYVAIEKSDHSQKANVPFTLMLNANSDYIAIDSAALYRKRIDLPTRESAKAALLNTPEISREIELCPARRSVRIVDCEERAICDRLVELTHLTDHRLAEVPRNACESCRRLEADSTTLNPIVASELFKFARGIIEAGGNQQHSVAEAEDLLKLAEDHLEWKPALATLKDNARFERNPLDCIHLDSTSLANDPKREFGLMDDRVLGCQHPNHEQTTLRNCQYCHDFNEGIENHRVQLADLIPVFDRYKPRITRWAVGITTSPRKDSTLEPCIDSVIRAGWSDFTLFVEKGTAIAAHQTHLPVTFREQRAGAWGNFVLALTELFLKDPSADAYFLLQDDAVLYDKENLREWLESALWPGPDIAAVSLYCSSVYNLYEPGWHRNHKQWTWGALAFIFPNQCVRRILADASIVDHSFQTKRKANIDVAIGRWARQNELGIYYPNPSLVQHIGESSTIWPAVGNRRKRRADWFAGDPIPSQHRAANPIVKPKLLPSDVRLDGNQATSNVALAFVTCFFNPAGFQTQRRNYERFREGLGEIANHLWTIELAFDDDPFTIEEERTIRVRGTRARHQLWQKERLLNLAQEHVPARYGAVGYIDCDLLFENSAWYGETCRLLERFRAVQLFTQVSLLSATGTVMHHQNTVVANPGNNGLFPGGGWAFHRELWPIQDINILGGGDTLFLWAMKGRFDHGKLPMMTDPWAYEWAKQAIDIYRKCGGKITSTPGVVQHLYHGSRKNRQYRDRWRNLFDGGFDPKHDLEIDPDVGIWRWTEIALQEKLEMVQAVSNYFSDRKEDE